MIAKGNQPKVATVPISKITVPAGRNTDPARVASLAVSIKENGLLQPVGLTAKCHLIYGAHRL